MPVITSATVTGYNLDSTYTPVLDATDTVTSDDRNTELNLQTSGTAGETVSVQTFDQSGTMLTANSFGNITSESQVFDV